MAGYRRTINLVTRTLQLMSQMLIGKTSHPGDENFALVHVRTKNRTDYDAIRRKSASTIIWHSCSNVVFASQPSFALTLAGLPINSPGSVAR